MRFEQFLGTLKMSGCVLIQHGQYDALNKLWRELFPKDAKIQDLQDQINFMEDAQNKK
jgi:type II secretory pathway component PulL